MLATLPALANLLHAQDPVEGLLVEKFHVTANPVKGAPPLVTYRIFIDLAEEHELHGVYGDDRHMLVMRTTTTFFNDTALGGPYGERIPSARWGEFPLALDSWLAAGFATDRHKAVPLHLDPDGSILGKPAGPKARRYQHSLHERDGLVAAARVPETTNLHITTGYLDRVPGDIVDTNIGVWGVLGGVKGATQENFVLIAQFTTDGELCLKLNVLVRTPHGELVRVVSGEAGPGEVHHDALTFGRLR